MSVFTKGENTNEKNWGQPSGITKSFKKHKEKRM